MFILVKLICTRRLLFIYEEPIRNFMALFLLKPLCIVKANDLANANAANQLKRGIYIADQHDQNTFRMFIFHQT